MRFAAVVFALMFAGSVRADSFDDYTSVHLKKAAADTGGAARPLKRINREDLIGVVDVLPKTEGAFLIVHTNDNRWAKLLVHPAAQKDKEASAPILLIERFVTYKEGEERVIVAEGKNVKLFDGFRFNLDIGAIVPEKAFAADLRVVEVKGAISIEPLGKAEIFLLVKHVAEAAAPKGKKIDVGGKFEKTMFAGDFKLFDDGRKTGDLHLDVTAKGEVSGWMFSTATGAKYEVQGTVGPNPAHGIQFTVTLPRTVQQFTGWMFTGNAAAIAGYSSIEGREAGFYAVRVE